MKGANNRKSSGSENVKNLGVQGEQSYKEPSIEIPSNEFFSFPNDVVYVDTQTHQLCAKDKNNVPYVVSDEIRLNKVTKNLDTQVVKVTLIHITKWSNSEIELTLEELKETKLYEVLSKKGVVVYEHCVGELAYYLFSQIQSYIDQYGFRFEHYRIGWGKKGRNSGFFASKSIQAPYYSSLANNKKKYLGQNGDRAIYDSMVQSEIIPNKSMHLPFVLGFTAPVVPLILKKSDAPVLLINFAGKSSMGKSTSMKLIASIWGKGVVSNKKLSVCKTFSATENAFEAAVKGNYGIPALFDDFQAATKETYFSDLVYRLTQGESRMRCNKKGSIIDTFDWSTFIGFTGERNLFDFLNKDLGLKARIIQFSNVEWTASEQNVININSVIDENYGFYGEEFVGKLLAKTDVELYQYYFDSKKVINDAIPTKDSVLNRLQNRLAIIRMTAVLVKELIEPNIDVDYITKFLVENEKKREAELDLFEDAKEKLLEFINKNIPNFVRKGIDPNYVTIPNSKVVGRMYCGKQGRLVAILPDEFDKIMKTFGDHDLILETWRNQGFLIAEKGRFIKRVRISELADSPRCYVFLFQDFGSLFNKLLGLEEINVKDLEDEDFISNLAEDPKNISYRRDPSDRNIKYRYVKVPDTPVVEKTNRVVKEYHDEYKHDPATVQNTLQVLKEELAKDDFDYDDEEAINAIFADEDSEEDDSDEDN